MRKLDDIEGNKGGVSSTQISDAQSEKQETSDWWDGFKGAVEDPDTNIYEYVRDQALQSFNSEEDERDRSFFEKARKKALKELVSLKDPKKLSDRLKNLEKNQLLFNYKARVMMQVARVVIDTYVSAQEELIKEKKKTSDQTQIKESLKQTVEKKLAENKVDQGIAALAKSLEDKDEEEIRETIEKAAKQLGEEESLDLFSKDFFKVARKYLTLDNMTEIAIVALPLITWQYRWALAAGLGVYAARKSIVHGYKAGAARLSGKKEVYQKEGKKAVESLKAAGGNVLVIGLSPFLGRAPKLFAGFLNFGVKSGYQGILNTLDEMLDEEEKKPGSTPLSKNLKKKTKKFLDKNQNSLASLSAKFLKGIVPTTVTVAIVELFNRLPFKKLSGMVARGGALLKSVKKRFNSAAEGEELTCIEDANEEGLEEIKEEFEAVKDDVIDVKQQIEETIAAVKEEHEQALSSNNIPPVSDSFEDSASENAEDLDDSTDVDDEPDVSGDEPDSPSP